MAAMAALAPPGHYHDLAHDFPWEGPPGAKHNVLWLVDGTSSNGNSDSHPQKSPTSPQKSPTSLQNSRISLQTSSDGNSDSHRAPSCSLPLANSKEMPLEAAAHVLEKHGFHEYVALVQVSHNLVPDVAALLDLVLAMLDKVCVAACLRGRARVDTFSHTCVSFVLVVALFRALALSLLLSRSSFVSPLSFSLFLSFPLIWVLSPCPRLSFSPFQPPSLHSSPCIPPTVSLKILYACNAHACAHTCTHTQHVCIHIHTYACTYTCTCVYIYRYMYRCRVRKMRTATHCNTLQHTATHCNTPRHIATHCNTLQHTATHCITLQHATTHCYTLQHSATHIHALAKTHTRTPSHTHART